MKYFFILFFASEILWAYPRILDWKNSPLVVFEDNSNALIKKNQELKAPFFALTSRLDEIRLELNTGNELSLAKNSKIQIYEVFEDVHQEHILFLIDGKIRFKNTKPKGPDNKTNRLRTPFFDLILPPNSEVVIQLDMKEPSVQVMMIKGSWEVEFFSYEKKAHLNAGQQVQFKGVLSDEPDQIKYDYLLENKKIPKGSMGDIKKFDAKKYEEEKKRDDAELLKKEKAEKKKIVAAVQKNKKFESSFLCQKPFGKLNQCVWKLEGEICYRKRCNVSGEWGDKTERPTGDSCTSSELVGRCDY